nr:helix-turn-helix domain-containing protein [uncultured Aliiroseovarius sp.]
MLTLTTEEISIRDRNEFWATLAAPFYRLTPPTKDDVVQAHLESRMFGSFMVGRRRFSARKCVRDRAMIARNGLDGYQLDFFVKGALIGDCDGTEIKLNPGDIGVWDYAQPHKDIQSAGASVMIYMPRDQIDKATGGRSAHGTVLRAGQSSTRIITNLAFGFADVMADIPVKDAMMMDHAAIDLFAAAVAGRLPQAGTSDATMHQTVRRQIVEFIDNHLGDTELVPDMLVDHFRMSRAQLYRMFPNRNGIAQIIRERRLAAAYRNLHQSRSDSITTIAHKYGFSSSNQFLRAFRRLYGITPTEARRMPMSPLVADPDVAGLSSHLATARQNWFSAKLG